MKFNTAILYDIENLIGGYGKGDMLASLSLKDIFSEIKKKETGKIAIQRAYANWSDPRLNILRGDIVELGIEPIQMFGFGKGSQKNASDIQLAIDAIDIAYTKNAIEVFVIVSGDGGFSSLAKKLHEYGKMVIGCAYKRTTNKVFEAVSDDFIWIEEPKDELLVSKNIITGTTLNNDPIVHSFTKKYKPILDPNREEIIRVSKEIFNFLAENRDAISLLSNVGLNISVLSQLLDYRLSGFNYFKLGFVKFTDFIRFSSYQTKCKIVFKAPSEYRLVLINTKLRGYEDLEYITEIGEIHTTDNYIKILEKGLPTFKQFNKEILFSIAEYLADNKMEFQEVQLGDVIDKLSDLFDFEQAEIKGAVMSIISGECFVRSPADAKLSEQKLSFIPQNGQQAITTIERCMRIKLENILNEIDENVFNEILQ
ncbi:MAG: NYN domain-containing protein [Saprospiraceae bacterium]|nr:NYN domain-containing protein [Saprospiraceae bacterium]